MKRLTGLIILIVILHLPARSQSRFQIAVDGGPTFTSIIKYKNCTGHINVAITESLAFLYKPDSSFGIELKISNLLNPKSYLNNDSDNTVRGYTTSYIILQHVLAGFNYYMPIKAVHPYLGLLLGASYAETKDVAPQSWIYNFSWGFQTGGTFEVSKSVALRVGGYALFIPNVPNNTSYFDVASDGSGFPSFIVGNPSTATITQWNISFGLLINLRKRN